MSSIYSDKDMEERRELRKIIKERDKKHPEMKTTITQKEWDHRRKLGLPCDGFILLSDLMKLRRL